MPPIPPIPPPVRRHLPWLVVGAILGAALVSVANSGFGTVLQTTPLLAPAVAGACGLPAAVFCDTFDAPAGSGNRSGDLNGTIWGVSRATANMNLNSLDNAWSPVDLQACGATIHVAPPRDVIICNGQLREGVNDAHAVTTLSMYPKQPFDFVGRTGKVVFDVSNDTLGTHDAWPELWVTDKPAPTPFNHFDTWQALPQNGFGVRMAAGAAAGQNGLCPNSTNIDKPRWTVDSAAVVRNYVLDDTAGYGTRSAMAVKILDCAVEPSGPDGGLNHVEVDVAQNQIDVYATDAGTTSPLRHLATISNANLSLTRGLLWLEDVHYNAAKACCNENGPHRQHTFTWDNVGFDGPFTYTDLAFDAPDNTKVNSDGTIDLARFSAPNQTATWAIPGMPAEPVAAAVRVLFNWFVYTNPPSLTVIVNGHVHTVPYPYPDQLTFTWRTLDVLVPITELVAGTNTVAIGSPQSMDTSNVGIVLSNVSTSSSTPVPTLDPSAHPATATLVPVTPTTAPSGGTTYSTTFPATENPISEAGRWLNGKLNGLDWTDARTTTNRAFGTEQGNGSYDDSTATITGPWGPSQAAQAKVYVSGVSGITEVELRLRTTITPHSITGYEFECSATSSPAYMDIVRWNGPLANFTPLAHIDGVFCANGDVLGATAVGNVLKLYKNGVVQLSATDSTYMGGAPGIGYYLAFATGINANYGFSSFAATDNGTLPALPNGTSTPTATAVATGVPATATALPATATAVATVIPATATALPAATATAAPSTPTAAPTSTPGPQTCTQVLTLNGTPAAYTRLVTECADR